MSREKRKRKKRLRAKRNRMHRAGTASSAPKPDDVTPMQFRCGTCGTEFEMPGTIVSMAMYSADQDGGDLQPVPLGGPVNWEAPCPVCGRQVSALNQVVEHSEGRVFLGFADTPQQYAALRAALETLRQAEIGLTVEEIASIIEQQGPQARPFADWVRRNKDLINAAGSAAGILAFILTLLVWVLGPLQEDQPQPPPPTGITEKDLERLIIELRDTPTPEPTQASVEPSQPQSGESDPQQGGHSQSGEADGTDGEASQRPR